MHFKKSGWVLSLILITCVSSSVFASNGSIDESLLAAVEEKNISQVRKLLDKGADIEARGMFKQTPLIMAASEKSTDIVKLLIARGCDVNATDEMGTTALHMGVRIYDIAELLLKAGADPWMKSKHGLNPLDFAAGGYTNRIEVLNLFLDLKPDQKVLNNALASAVEGGNPKKVKVMINAGAEISPSGAKKIPLIVAADNGAWSAARELLRKGAQVDQRDSSGGTALYRAVMREDLGMVRLLLQYGANPQGSPQGDLSPLAYSLGNEKYDICRLLVAAGADVQEKYYGSPIIDVAKSQGPQDLADFMENGTSEKIKKDLWIDAPVDQRRHQEINHLLAGNWRLKESETKMQFSNQKQFRWSIDAIFSTKVLEGFWDLENGDLSLNITRTSEGEEKPFQRKLALVRIDQKNLVFDGILERIRYERVE